MRTSNQTLVSLGLIVTIVLGCSKDKHVPSSSNVSVAPDATSVTLNLSSAVDGATIPVYVGLPQQRTQPLKTVIILHGSGGQWLDEDINADGIADVCDGNVLSRQSNEWLKMLTEKGYAVAFPDSYSPRGTCENEGPYKQPPLKFKISATFIRPSDVIATYDGLRSLVSSASGQRIIDEKNIILLGFSDGASAVISTLYNIESTPSSWRWTQSFDGAKYTEEILAPDKRLREKLFKAGVAYYPGAFHNGYYGDLCKQGSGIYQSYCDLMFQLPLGDPLTPNSECLINTMTSNGGGQASAFRYDATGHGFDANIEPQSTLARVRTLEFIISKFGDK